MLKKRVAASLLIKDQILVKGKNFNNYRTLNDIITAIKIFCLRDIDELFIFDIGKTLESKNPDFNFLSEISKNINVPFCYGGGIKTLDDAKWCLWSGADKISINSILFDNFSLLKNLSKIIGSQSVVVSIDYVKKYNNFYCVSKSGKIITDYDPILWVKKCEDNGCGEIILCSIDKEGTMTGYDIELIYKLKNKVKIPIIVSGGAGSYVHFLEAFKAGVSCVAAGSIYHFTNLTPTEAKKFLQFNSIPVRDGHKYI